jgi:hypothetical protein
VTIVADQEDHRRRLSAEQATFSRFFKGLLVFIVVWPGLLTILLTLGWLLFQRPVAVEAAAFTAVRDAGIALAFGYLLGFVPATIIGMLISWLQVRSRLNVTRALLIAAIVGSCASLLEFDKDGALDAAGKVIDFAIKFFAAFAATFGCWARIQRWAGSGGTTDTRAPAEEPSK